MSGYILTLVEFCIAFCLHSLALLRLMLIFRYKLKTGKEIAPFLIALLLNWSIVCALLIPYEAYGIAVWRPVAGVTHSGPALFFIALPAHLFLAMIPVSVFYLTLERILIIYFGANYGDRAKRVSMCSYLLILLICFGICMTGFMSALPVAKNTDCEIFGCILGQAVDVYLGWRAFCSVFNFSSGIAFFVLLYRSHKRLMSSQQAFVGSAVNKQWKKQQSKNNKMTVLAIINEFFLAFLPHFGPFIWEKIYGPGSSMGTGPLSEIMSSFEVLIFVSVYSQVLKSGGQNSTLLQSGQGSQHVASRANQIVVHNSIPRRSSQFQSPSRATRSYPKY